MKDTLILKLHLQFQTSFPVAKNIQRKHRKKLGRKNIR